MKIKIEKIPDKILKGKKDKYKIIGYIDAGGGGNVFLCNDSNGNELAGKVFSRLKDGKRGIKRFKNEIKGHLTFEHPNIIKAFDSGTIEYNGITLPFYVMPKAKYNLKEHFVSNNIKNRPDEIKEIFIEILNGLICLHQNDCYHRDLKPQNILVLEDNDKIVVADFGIAHFTEKYKETSIITDPEERLRNNKYWAPEQGTSEDYRIDIYALGLIFHELVAGVFPRGTSYLVSLENPLFDEDFDKITAKMTKPDKNDRYQTLEEVKIEIERYFKMKEPKEERNILEENIYRQLLKLNKKAADEFKFAISTLKTQEHPGRFSQSANSFNYICKLLRDVKDDWFKNPEVVPIHANRYITSLFEKLTEICKYFSQLSNHEFEVNNPEFDEQLLKFEEILNEILRSNIDTLARLDILLEKKVPTQEDIKELIRLLNKPSHSQYFFSKLSSPDWIDLLIEKDFFIEPKALSVEGALNVSIWPQVNYLIKVSQYQPEKVMPIIKDLAKTKNYNIFQPLLTCLYNMPTNISKEALSTIKNWMSYYYSIPELVVLKKLVNKFIFEGDIESSYELIEILYDVKEPEIKTDRNSLDSKFYFLISDYEDFFDKLINIDIQTSSNKYLELLCNKLSELFDSTPHMDSDKFNDYSDIWRDSMESKSQGYEIRDARNFLINQIRDYLNKLAENNLELIQSGYELLTRYKWSIFARIQLYIINKYPDLFTNQLNESSINQIYFETPIYWIEYYDLMKNNFLRLSDENKQKIFNWIRAGPDLKKERISPDDFTDEDKFQDYSEQFKSSWIRRRAEPIKDHLPLDLKDKYETLILKNGELKHPQYHSYHEGPRFFSGSPLNKEQLAKLSNNELTDYLRGWKTSEEEFFSTKEGLGVFLSREISENPKKRKDLIFDFEVIPIVYLPYIISGFSDAIKERKVEFIDIFIGIIEIFKAVRENEEPVENINIWREIARLLQVGLKFERHDLSQDLIDELWEIISFFLIIKDPDEEAIDDISYEDFTTYSINTFKGIILGTLFQYAFYRSRILDLPKSKRTVPEVEDKLNELLDPEIESVKIIRSILSLHLTDLYYFCEQWTSTKIPILFPRENRELWKIAWESYVIYNNLNATIYTQLKEHYKIAITEMLSISSSRALEYLAYHIILLYVNEIEDSSEDSILKLFFKAANSDLRSRAMWFSVKTFDNIKDTEESEKLLDRILGIWDYRIKEAQSNQDLTFKNKYDEFHWFGLLFEKLDIKGLYLQLLLEILDLTEGQLGVFTHSILEVLKQYAEIEPQDVLTVIKKLTQSKSQDWLYTNTEKTIIQIIEIINDGYDIKNFQPIIEEIAEILIEKGYPEIRNLKYLKM